MMEEAVKKMCPFIVVDGKNVNCLANGCAKWETTTEEHAIPMGMGGRYVDGKEPVGGKCGIKSL